MEISGQRLSIPRNFFFLNRLPSRFEILVVARGATMPKGTAFELEIQGQRLVLHSKIDLKVGTRYELEKVSAFEFKILGEKTEEKTNQPGAETQSVQVKKSPDIEATGYFFPETGAAYVDLLALKVLANSDRKIEAKGDKYLFSFESESRLSGVFVPLSAGSYTLFVSGHGVGAENLENLAAILSPLGIQNIRAVSSAVLQRISAGAVDIKT